MFWQLDKLLETVIADDYVALEEKNEELETKNEELEKKLKFVQKQLRDFEERTQKHKEAMLQHVYEVLSSFDTQNCEFVLIFYDRMYFFLCTYYILTECITVCVFADGFTICTAYECTRRLL